MNYLFSGEKIISTQFFDVHQDRKTPIPGFFIIEALRPIRSFAEFTNEEGQEFIKLLITLRKGMKEVLGFEVVYFFQNEDSNSYFHLWVFPRHEWMEQFGKKIQSVRPIKEYAEQQLATEEMKTQVKDAVAKMKVYMQEFYNKF